MEQKIGYGALMRLELAAIPVLIMATTCAHQANQPIQPGETRTFTIDDYQYRQGKFFFLTDPDGPPMTSDGVGTLDIGTVQVWIDDRNGNNDTEQGAVPCYVTLDGMVATVRDSIRAGKVAKGEYFRLTVSDYTIQSDLYSGYPVLILADSQALEGAMTKALAVSYQTSRGSVGGSLGSDPDTLVLKLIRPAADMGGTRPTDLSQGIFAPAAKLELRNVYDLGKNLSPDQLVVYIRHKVIENGVKNPDRIGDHTFLEITGLDLFTESGSNRVAGPDGKIDDARINYELGYVMFRQLQPFAPTLADSLVRSGPPDPRPPISLIDRTPVIYTRDYWTDYDANSFSKYYFEVWIRTAR